MSARSGDGGAILAAGHPPLTQRNAASFPGELIGEWKSSHSSSTLYVNPNTGSYNGPSGDRMHYRFFPDGHYIEAGLIQSSLYNCTTQVYGYKTGVYRVEGSNLILDEKTYTLTSKDNCHREWNYEKHPPLHKKTFQWRLEQGQSGLKLVMTIEGK
jgi:hypothetical protein